MKLIDLTGQTFGRLTVLVYKGSSKWLCECSCTKHNQVTVQGFNLKSGNTKSCGCYQKERIHEVNSITSKKEWIPEEVNKDTYGIALTKGYVALISKSDLDIVKGYGWHVNYNKNNDSYYAQTEIEGKGISMHRLLLNAPAGVPIDHKNHNTLDNRRVNLRLCSNSQNSMNSKTRCDSSTGYKGVSFHRGSGKYRARIMIKGVSKHIGTFDTGEEASEAYKKAAKELQGVFYYE